MFVREWRENGDPTSPPSQAPRNFAGQIARLTRSAAIRYCPFSSDGELIAIAGDDRNIYIVSFRCLAQRIHLCSPSRSAPLVMIQYAHSNKAHAQVSVFSGQTVAKIAVTGVIMCIAWHPNKNWLVYSTNARTMATPVWYIAYQD